MSADEIESEPHTFTPRKFEKWMISFDTPQNYKARSELSLLSPALFPHGALCSPTDDALLDELSVDTSHEDALELYGDDACEAHPSLASFDDSLLLACDLPLDDDSLLSSPSASPSSPPTPVTATPLLRHHRPPCPLHPRTPLAAQPRGPQALRLLALSAQRPPQEHRQRQQAPDTPPQLDLPSRDDATPTPPAPVLRTTRLYAPATLSAAERRGRMQQCATPARRDASPDRGHRENVIQPFTFHSSSSSLPTTTTTTTTTSLNPTKTTTTSTKTTIPIDSSSNLLTPSCSRSERERAAALQATPSHRRSAAYEPHWTTPFKPADLAASLAPAAYQAHWSPDIPLDSSSEASPIPPSLVTTRLSTLESDLHNPRLY